MATTTDLRTQFLAGTRREIRKQEARERQKARNGRSAREQLQALDKRLGIGVGAKKERNRLAG